MKLSSTASNISLSSFSLSTPLQKARLPTAAICDEVIPSLFSVPDTLITGKSIFTCGTEEITELTFQDGKKELRLSAYTE